MTNSLQSRKVSYDHADAGTEPAFDQFAADYKELHAANLGASGEEPSYFADYKVREVTRCLAGRGLRRILDFGCGVGGSIPYLRNYFPASSLVGVDVSQESLQQAELLYRTHAESRHLAAGDFPVEQRHYCMAFAACVFHHIPPAEHHDILRRLHSSLTPHGHFFLFEHNPLNPLTVHAVNTCPFDADAILIHGREMARRVRMAGFSQVRLRFCTFFPRSLAGLRPLEPQLAWLPLGAQYYVWARP